MQKMLRLTNRKALIIHLQQQRLKRKKAEAESGFIQGGVLVDEGLLLSTSKLWSK